MAPRPRLLLACLLASPPALRGAVISQAFRVVGVTKISSTTLARSGTTHTHTEFSIQARYYFSRTKFQATAAPSDPTALANSTTEPRSDGLVSQDTQTPRHSRIRRIFFNTSLILLFFTTGLVMAAAPVAEAVNGFISPPSDAETLELFEPATQTAAEINEYIVHHPLSSKLREQEGMVESRPHMKIPPAMRPHNLTGGTLLGENKIEVPPLTFTDKDAELPTLVQIAYLGPALCGHPGIVHGGLLATMLDEGLARACFPALPNKVGVTASLKIDYRLPCPGSSYVVLKAQTTKVEGRKAWVKGTIELLGEEDGTGKTVVEAEALFIEPKQAKQMARVYSTQS